ncbi:MAG: hypothetical protein SFV21_11040 [Rhodospirillaceae bacterium]|nr:hypothetical protein [Rhodospirillaceae bacterium]
MIARAIALFAAALLIAACGSVPQPFKGTQKVTSDLAVLDVPSAVGIAVLSPAGVPEPLAGEIARAVAKGLETYDIPAEAVATNGGLGFTLSGRAAPVAAGGDPVALAIDWSLVSRRGETAGRYAQSAQVPRVVWQSGGGSAQALGQEVAQAVARMIDAATPIPASAGVAPPVGEPAPNLPRVSVKPVEGAPGDGREALQLAMIQVLAENGVKRDDVSPDVVVIGRVDVRPAVGGEDFVEIFWRAIGQDGQDLGEAKLSNTIPRGALDGAWGATAFAIAEAAAPDLMTLLALVPPR